MPDLVETTGVKSAGGRPYSPAVRAGDCIYLSGQVPIDAEGRTVGTVDPAAQWRQCLDNIKELLESAGAAMRDVVFLQLFVTDMDEVYLKHAEIRREYFEVPFPASTVTETSRLAQPDWMIEIQAVAYVGR
jgi:enamine deaminase RidA (YjgF/YER057c/UK114 family)